MSQATTCCGTHRERNSATGYHMLWNTQGKEHVTGYHMLVCEVRPNYVMSSGLVQSSGLVTSSGLVVSSALVTSNWLVTSSAAFTKG